MDIIFYKLQDEVNDVKKLRTLTATATYEPMTVQGSLKAPTSKIAPVIEFGQDITYFNGYNYCYIADFNRYYFVEDMVSIRVSVTSISLRVDVLTSFLTQSNIGSIEGFVGRCANSLLYETKVPDKVVQFGIEPTVTIEEATYLPSIYFNNVNTTFDVNATYNVMVSYSQNLSVEMTVTDVPIPTILQPLYNNATSIKMKNLNTTANMRLAVTDGYETNYTGTDTGISTNLSELLLYLIKNDNYASVFNSITIYPFSLPKDTIAKVPLYTSVGTIPDSRSPISNPTVYASDLIMYQGKTYNSGFLITNDFIMRTPNEKNNFMDYEPYNKCEMFIPFVGWTQINLKTNLNCRILVYYNVDYVTGRATVYVYNATRNEIVFETNVQLGIELPINTTNLRENTLKDQNYTRNYVTSLLLSGATAIAGAVSGQYYLTGAGISGAVSASVKYVSNENLLLDKGSNNVSSGSATSSYFAGMKVLLKWTQLNPTNYTSSNKASYISHLGIPTNKIAILSSIPVTGDYHTYAEIEDLHTTTETGLYSIDDITYIEVEELKKLCSEGIYL